MTARNTLIMLEAAGFVENEHGEEVEGFNPIGSEWAAVFYGRGDERRQAAMERASQAATFNFLSNGRTRGLTIRDRLVTDDPWDITSIAPDTPRPGEIEITATRSPT